MTTPVGRGAWRGGGDGRGEGGFGSRGGSFIGGRRSDRGGCRGGRGRPLGRGRGRGRGGPGLKLWSNVVVEPHNLEGLFILKFKYGRAICAKSTVPGEALYKDTRISVQNEDGTKVDYNVWKPSSSKLAAAVHRGVKNIWIKPGARVLYLGAASRSTVSHISDLVGPNGVVYAVESCPMRGLELVIMSVKRTNVILIIEDPGCPFKYRMLVGMVDVIFLDVCLCDQVAILSLNAAYFLRIGGHFVTSLKGEVINTSEPATALVRFRSYHLMPMEFVDLEVDIVFVVGDYVGPVTRKRPVAAASSILVKQ